MRGTVITWKDGGKAMGIPDETARTRGGEGSKSKEQVGTGEPSGASGAGGACMVATAREAAGKP